MNKLLCLLLIFMSSWTYAQVEFDYCIMSEVKIFTSEPDPRTWMKADGRALEIKKYRMLFELLGNDYGGDEETFNLPDIKPTKVNNRHADYYICYVGDNTGYGSNYILGSMHQFPTRKALEKNGVFDLNQTRTLSFNEIGWTFALMVNRFTNQGEFYLPKVTTGDEVLNGPSLINFLTTHGRFPEKYPSAFYYCQKGEIVRTFLLDEYLPYNLKQIWLSTITTVEINGETADSNRELRTFECL